jgi:hypothetical protein
MKPTLLVLGLLALLNPICGQGKGFFFNEYTVSINRTCLKDDNTENRFGFGIGTDHLFRADKKINVILGLEYNRTNQLKKEMADSPLSYSKDVTFTQNGLSVPLGLRINTGSKIKIFAEGGIFGDLAFRSTQKGTSYTYTDDGYVVDHFSTKADLSDSYGYYFGLGIRVPFSKYELMIKPDYKVSVNTLYSGNDNIYNRYIRLSVEIRMI